MAGLACSFKDVGNGNARVQAKLRKASAEIRRRFSELAGASLLKLTMEDFRLGRDPYGKAWKTPKHRVGQPLLNTGRLRNSFSAERHDGDVTIVSETQYASYLQYGTKHMEKRALVPDSRGMPWLWKVTTDAAAKAAVEGAL